MAYRQDSGTRNWGKAAGPCNKEIWSYFPQNVHFLLTVHFLSSSSLKSATGSVYSGTATVL